MKRTPPLRSTVCVISGAMLLMSGCAPRERAVILPPALQAQTISRGMMIWDVLYNLEEGREVKVVRADATEVEFEGRVVAVTEDAITVRQRPGRVAEEIEIPRDQVFQVLVRKKSRVKNALIGAGAGPVVVLAKPHIGEAFDGPATFFGVMLLVSTIGAVIGAFVPPGYNLVYESGATIVTPPAAERLDLGRPEGIISPSPTSTTTITRIVPLLNPGFEDGPSQTAWQLGTNGPCTSPGKTPTVYDAQTADSSNVHTGRYSLRYTFNSDKAWQIVDGPVAAGTTVTLSAWVKMPTPGSTQTKILTLEFQGINNFGECTWRKTSSPEYSGPFPDWTLLHVDFDVPTAVARVSET